MKSLRVLERAAMIEDAYVEWAKSTLAVNGYNLLAAPQTLRSMPWSTVICFQTSRGRVFLKSMALGFNYEAELLSFLNKQKIAHVPRVVAIHPKNNLFLMQDAGELLLSKLKSQYDLALVKRGLKFYADLQHRCVPLVEQLVALGIRDIRLKKLPVLFELFLEDDLGFSVNELNSLRKSTTTLSDMCDALEAIGIPETLDHGDFTDDNILIKDEEITFNDFGDAAISHPFFSIVSFLNSAENEHGLDASSKKYLALRDFYLNEWNTYASLEALVQGFEIANRLTGFVWALGLKRIKQCPGIEDAEYRSYVEKVLNHFYATLNEK